MSNKRAGVLVFFVGLTIMALSAIMGKVLQSQLFELGFFKASRAGRSNA
jgi:hypothetical protein